MENNVGWLDSKSWVLVSPQEFSRFALINLKGVHTLIENHDIDSIQRGKKTLIPVPIINYYAMRKAESLGSLGEVNWRMNPQKKHDSKENE